MRSRWGSRLRALLREGQLAWRAFWLRRRGVTVGARLRAYAWPIVHHPEQIALGDDCTLNHGVVLNGRGSLTIGHRVRISAYAVLETGSLELDSSRAATTARDRRQRVHTARPIRVGDDVWIATGAIVLPGVTIGAGAVVAAGAVVTRDVPADHLARGVPARCHPLPRGGEPPSDGT